MYSDRMHTTVRPIISGGFWLRQCSIKGVGNNRGAAAPRLAVFLVGRSAIGGGGGVKNCYLLYITDYIRYTNRRNRHSGIVIDVGGHIWHGTLARTI